jgi:hypothetical protein
MHTATRVALALGATLTGATLLGQTVGTASPTASTPRGSVERVETTMLLSMPWTGGHSRYLDRGRKGPSAGDVFLLTDQPVNDEHTGRRIGAADAVELILSGRHDGTVTSQSTLRLPGGHVEVDGIIRHTDDPIRVTVTGGTQRFAGAGGQMVLLRADPDRKVSIVRLELTLP